MPTEDYKEADENEDEDLSRRPIPLYQILPTPIRKRIKALKKLQFQTIQLEAKFFCDVHKLEGKYTKAFAQLYQKRENIVKGTIEPTDEDCDFNEGYDTPDDEEPVIKELRSKLTITKLVEDGATGIPEFWLTVFKNIDILNDMIQSHDEPILRHLIDITSTLRDDERMGFILHFHFSQNPYFSNSVLTKEYQMKCAPDPDSPWTFEGPEIIGATGCTVNWNKGMNVTVKTVQKRQKHKSGGAVRTIIKTVQNSSFFNFFTPPTIQDDQEGTEEIQELLENDYEIGSFIREKIIPHAVLYYTGEAVDIETEEEMEEDEDGRDNEDESEEGESQGKQDSEEGSAEGETDDE
ncbi:unnamed protein product [Nezara viridula]|uniref:Uncharacterized protein n=1 Tax=Nezara viridula TaxID=85310 RepID=A0A9P0HEZ8_NEZVI|nr:unnamed protein product [Nezara viridula]